MFTQVRYCVPTERPFGMIDLKEATSSLDSYAGRLDLLCRQYELMVSWAEVEKKTPDVEPKAAGLIDDVAVELTGVYREALTLSILISETGAKEGVRLL